jgi:hypothetical protein
MSAGLCFVDSSLIVNSIGSYSVVIAFVSVEGLDRWSVRSPLVLSDYLRR